MDVTITQWTHVYKTQQGLVVQLVRTCHSHLRRHRFEAAAHKDFGGDGEDLYASEGSIGMDILEIIVQRHAPRKWFTFLEGRLGQTSRGYC